jgi:hypothetical protein
LPYPQANGPQKGDGKPSPYASGGLLVELARPAIGYNHLLYFHTSEKA